MKSLPLIVTALAVLAAAVPGRCQSLQFTVNAGAGTINVPPGGAAAVTAANIGQPVNAVVTVRNTGSATASLTGVSIAGTTEMTLALTPNLPLSLIPNGSASFGVQYFPPSGNTVSAQISIVAAINSQSTTFSFSLTGTSPRLTYSYVLPASAATDLNSGDRITFPATGTGSSSNAVVTVFNRGSATALIPGVTVTGAGFQLSGPLGSFQLAAGTQASFLVLFTPSSATASQGLLTLTLATGAVAFPLTGTATFTNLTATYAFSDGNVRVLTDGAAIVFPAIDINTTATANIEITNQGTAAGTISAIAVGGNGFRLAGSPALPATVGAGQSLRFGIVFAPTQAGSYTGSFRMDLAGRSISGNLTASTAAATVSLAYIDPDTNNVIALRDGGTLPFPNTAAGGSSSLALVMSNSGAGTALINSIVVNAATPAFQLLNLPALPSTVPPGQQLRFGVRFSPPQQQAFSGALLVSVNGLATTINLQGQGSAPQFTYAYGPGPTAAVPGSAIALGETTVGQSASITVSIANAGNADGQVSAIGVSGAGMALSDLPPLPLTLHAGGSQSFTLTFAPTQPGAVSGRMTIGSDTFTVSGTGIGSRLTYSYTNAAAAVPVAEGGAVIFPPLEVGKSEKLQFAIQNTGTSAAAISSISLSVPSASFALEQLPALPLSLAAGATATFGVSFAPGAAGTLTASLLINSATFSLSGSGTQPPALPTYQFQAPTNSAQPTQQPAIGLTLAAPYAVAIDGTLKLTFISSVFTDDPSIQFATGGRTVNFTIPANSTQAMFNGIPSISLQTGTTAGSIVITPSFTMRSGFDLTPASPDALTLPIPRTAPQLLSATLTSQTATSFTLVLNGYSTTREMRQLDVQFTPKQGESFSTTKITFDVTTPSASWYQSAASQGAGGSFLAAIPFVLASGSSTDDLVHRLQSLTVTATNNAGVSTAVTVPMQ